MGFFHTKISALVLRERECRADDIRLAFWRNQKERDLDGNTTTCRNSLTRIMSTVRLYRIRSKALVDLLVYCFPQFTFSGGSKEKDFHSPFALYACVLSKVGRDTIFGMAGRQKRHMRMNNFVSSLCLKKGPGHRQS